jgi:hypothetical protein
LNWFGMAVRWFRLRKERHETVDELVGIQPSSSRN